MATAIATLWFNKGHKGFKEVLQELGVLPIKELISLSEQTDQRRMKKNVCQTDSRGKVSPPQYIEQSSFRKISAQAD